MLGEISELLSHNIYAYCRNNPVCKFDPSGKTIVDTISGATSANDGGLVKLFVLLISALLSATQVKPKSDTQERPRTRNNPTYYHATTPENAELITTSGMLKGSSLEAGRVFAWKLLPTKKAIQLSGANFTRQVVVISFQTATAFEPDSGIENIYALNFGPVVSVLTGPIYVQNVMTVATYDME